MPTYDYECRSCGNRIEVIHPMREDGPTTCEVCGGALKRVLYPTGIIFKGSGFYSTDSRSGGSSSSASRPAKAADGEVASNDGASKGAESGKGEAASTGSAPATSGGSGGSGGSSGATESKSSSGSGSASD